MAKRKLVRALQRAFNMLTDDAKQLAETVEGVFQGEEEVNDEDLDKDVRSLFYSLEREKLVTIRRTEYKFEGQVRRAYFWQFTDLDKTLTEPASPTKQELEMLEMGKLYRQLPQGLWSRKATGDIPN
jgi:hypothetical protein